MKPSMELDYIDFARFLIPHRYMATLLWSLLIGLLVFMVHVPNSSRSHVGNGAERHQTEWNITDQNGTYCTGLE